METKWTTLLASLLLAFPVGASTIVKRGPFTPANHVTAASAILLGTVPVSAYTDPNPWVVEQDEILGGHLWVTCTSHAVCRLILPSMEAGEAITVISAGTNPIRVEPDSGDRIFPETQNAGDCMLSGGDVGDLLQLTSMGVGTLVVTGSQGIWIDVGSC